VSRTWGRKLEIFQDVERALIDSTLKAAMLLRRDNLLTTALSLFIRYGYRHYGECGYLTEDIFFEDGLMSDIELVEAVRLLLRKFFQPGRQYTQGGVILCMFKESEFRQKKIFDDGPARRGQYEKLTRVADEINRHLGGRHIYPATLAVKDKPWLPNRQHLSSGRLELNRPAE
jgi:DNA polymerase V